jgi:hypothetical protein
VGTHIRQHGILSARSENRVKVEAMGFDFNLSFVRWEGSCGNPNLFSDRASYPQPLSLNLILEPQP